MGVFSIGYWNLFMVDREVKNFHRGVTFLFAQWGIVFCEGGGGSGATSIGWLKGCWGFYCEVFWGIY